MEKPPLIGEGKNSLRKENLFEEEQVAQEWIGSVVGIEPSLPLVKRVKEFYEDTQRRFYE